MPTFTGMISLVGDDAGLVPTALVAVTVNVYATPLVRPATTHALVAVVHVKAPGLEVTV